MTTSEHLQIKQLIQTKKNGYGIISYAGLIITWVTIFGSLTLIKLYPIINPTIIIISLLGLMVGAINFVCGSYLSRKISGCEKKITLQMTLEEAIEILE